MSADAGATAPEQPKLALVTGQAKPLTFKAIAACPAHFDRVGQEIELPGPRTGRQIVMSGVREPICPCRR